MGKTQGLMSRPSWSRGPCDRAAFTSLGSEVQTGRETQSQPHFPLHRGVLPGPFFPGTPTHHPLVHICPTLALQTGLQSLVDIVGCPLGWLQPLLHLGGGAGVMDPRRLLLPLPLPFLFPPSGDLVANSLGNDSAGAPSWCPSPALS